MYEFRVIFQYVYIGTRLRPIRNELHRKHETIKNSVRRGSERWHKFSTRTRQTQNYVCLIFVCIPRHRFDGEWSVFRTVFEKLTPIWAALHSTWGSPTHEYNEYNKTKNFNTVNTFSGKVRQLCLRFF